MKLGGTPMANNRIPTFVVYVLEGVYRARANAKKKFLLSISRKSLLRVLGGERFGAAQKEELRDACRSEGIGLVELPDRLLFFDPEDIKDFTIEIDDRER